MSAIYLNGTKLTGADNASNVVAQDVLGLVEQAGDDTTVQALLDEIAARVDDTPLSVSDFKSVVAASSDFADFKTRVAAL